MGPGRCCWLKLPCGLRCFGSFPIYLSGFYICGSCCWLRQAVTGSFAGPCLDLPVCCPQPALLSLQTVCTGDAARKPPEMAVRQLFKGFPKAQVVCSRQSVAVLSATLYLVRALCGVKCCRCWLSQGVAASQNACTHCAECSRSSTV